MSNRAKKMVALALNIELREKNANIKSENKAVRAKKDDDPEYLPGHSIMNNVDLSSFL